ncbi:MAG: lysoplasmalogenase [Aeromicrobium sp.]
MTALRSPWLMAFAAMSILHLGLNVAEVSPWESITKCLIMPLLAAWVFTEDGPRLIVAALLISTVGDFFMEFDDLFTLGMAAFAIAHICFIYFFVSRGALGRLRKKPWIVLMYAAVAIALVAFIWSDLPADIKPFIPVYAALLAGTAATSLATDGRAGLGGALFLVSDAVIALGEADKWQPEPSSFWIMLFYILGLFFLSAGILNRERNTRAAGPDFDPTIRTDCWPRLPAARDV